MTEEMKTDLSGIYRLIIHCVLCITLHLSGKPLAIQLIWGRLVLLLERWGKYSEAEEEGFALLESLRTLLVTPSFSLHSTVVFLLDPSVVRSAGANPIVCEVVITPTLWAFKRQLRGVNVFKRILVLAEQINLWICIMETNAMTKYHAALIKALHSCTFFLVFIARCIFLCKTSLFDLAFVGVDENLVDLAKYVDALLDFISKFAKGFYSSGKVACKDGSELSLEVTNNMQQPSEALEVCCKTILKHIELLCQPQLTYSKSI